MLTENIDVEMQELGWCTARIQMDRDNPERTYLLIFSPSVEDETHSSPASDLRIASMRNILKLRDFLNEVYPKSQDASNSAAAPK